jgi:methionyl-tRNA formyltransferase
LRTAYLGTSDFAASVLRRLAESEHKPALVVTPPDRPKGRGRKLASPPAADAARELGLKLHQAESVNDEGSLIQLREAAPDSVVVCAFGQLIKEPLLSEWTMLNVHPSLLPRWRGAAPIERSVMAGDAETGVTIMRVAEGLDSGPIALQDSTPVEPGEYFGDLESRLAALGGELLLAALDRLERGELAFAEQEDEAATYAEKIGAEDRRLDPARPAAELELVVRALNPHVGTYVELEGGERLGVRRAHAVAAGPAPGEFETGDASLLLGTGEGALALEQVQPPGGKAMAATDFMRGHGTPTRAASR